MNKKNKIMWTLCILSWVCCVACCIVRPFSIIAWRIIFSIQVICLLGIIVIGILTVIQIKREEKEFEKRLEEDRKHLEELIKGYLTFKLSEGNSDVTIEDVTIEADDRFKTEE